MEISDAAVEEAERHMRERMESTARAISARYDRRVGRIVVSLNNGLELAFPPHRAEGLAGAKPADLAIIEVTPTGLGLHWPKLDADLYLPSLLQGVFGSPRWMAGLLGKSGRIPDNRPEGGRRKRRDRQVLGLEDFTDADVSMLEQSRAADASKAFDAELKS